MPDFEFTDITYHRAVEPGTVRYAFNRPEVRNAFRPRTVDDLHCARARPPPRPTSAASSSPATAPRRSTAAGPSSRAATSAFAAPPGYRKYEDERRTINRPGRPPAHPRGAAPHPLHAQGRHLRRTGLGGRGWPQPPRRVRPDARQRRAPRFKQTDADVASFDGGFGSAYLARQVGQKLAREIFFLGPTYSAEEALAHGRGQRGGPPLGVGEASRWSGRLNQRQEPDVAAACSSSPST